MNCKKYLDGGRVKLPKIFGAESKTTRVEFSKEEEEEEEEGEESQLLRIIDKILVKATARSPATLAAPPRLTPSTCGPE